MPCFIRKFRTFFPLLSFFNANWEAAPHHLYYPFPPYCKYENIEKKTKKNLNSKYVSENWKLCCIHSFLEDLYFWEGASLSIWRSTWLMVVIENILRNTDDLAHAFATVCRNALNPNLDSRRFTPLFPRFSLSQYFAITFSLTIFGKQKINGG